VYFSNTDITGQLAKACIGQAEQAGAQVYIHQIMGCEIIEGRFENHSLFEELLDCNAIIFASPTYMGGAAAQFKAFADASSEYWAEQRWAGKVAAGITAGTAPNGDQTSTLQYFSTLAAQHGMYWVGLDLAAGYSDRGLNRLGCQLGVTAEAADGINGTDIETARYLGQRVAGNVAQLKGEM
jgi:multimeric flavodoxin WrbA